MGRVCLNCGDKGFSNAFIYCVKCLDDVVHRYCLHKLPETFDEFVHWVCDDCEAELPKELTSPKSYFIESEGRDSKDVDGQLTVVKSERKNPRMKLQHGKRKRASFLGQEAKRRLESSPSKQLQDAELANSSPLSTEFKKKEGSCSSSKLEDQRLRLVKAFQGLELTEESRRAHDETNGTSSKDVEGQWMVTDSEGTKRASLPQRVKKKKKLLPFAEVAKRGLESGPSEQAQDAELATSSPLSTEVKKASCLVEDHRLQPVEANTKLTEESNRTSSLGTLEKNKRDVSSANLSDQGAKECLEASQLASGHLKNNLILDSHESAHDESNRTSSKDIEGQWMVTVSEGTKRASLLQRVKKKKKRLLLAEVAKRGLESGPSEQAQDAELATSSPLSTEVKKASCLVEDHRLQPVEANTKLTEESNRTSSLGTLEKNKRDVSSANLSDQGAKECLEASQLASGHLKNNLILDSHESAHDEINRTSSKDIEGQWMVTVSEGTKRASLPQRVKKKKKRLLLAEVAKRGLESGPSEQAQDAELATSSPLSTEVKKASCLVEDHRLQPVETNTKLTEESNRTSSFGTLEKNKRDVKFSSANLSDQGAKECLEASQLASGHLKNNLILDSHEHAQPFIEPIWRGGFIILNKDYDAFDGLVAHLSIKACRMVYEEASLFPSLLDLEMLPKLDVWPKSFQKSEPSDDNIALYFFPSDKRYERLFDHLVDDMMHQGLALRAIVKNADLLVFTSTELPLSHWRFQGKYYLWGVFRGKRALSS